jgi:histidinol-phosphate aminotransferase
VGGYGQPTKLRISIGSAEDNQRFLDALEGYCQRNRD